MTIKMLCGHDYDTASTLWQMRCTDADCTTWKLKVVDPDTVDLTNRYAECVCGHTADSRVTLPFFRVLPMRDADDFYCGHGGWD